MYQNVLNDCIVVLLIHLLTITAHTFVIDNYCVSINGIGF